MNSDITNKYKIDEELYIDFFYYHITKPLRIICGLMSVVGIINFIILLYTNIVHDIQNTKGIIFDIIITIFLILLALTSASILGAYEYEKLRQTGEDALYFETIFKNNEFIIKKYNIEKMEKYDDIKKIYLYDTFIVLKMKNKDQYLLKLDSFNIEDINEFLIKIEGGNKNNE